MILTWLNVHLWGPMWPNIFSPNAWSLGAIGVHLAVTLAQRARHHREAEQRADERSKELKQHVTNTLGGSGD